MVDLALGADTAASPPIPPGRRSPTTKRARRGAISWTARTIAVLYVGLLALVPVIVILIKTFQPGLHEFFAALITHDSLHAFEVSAIVAGIAVLINAVFGIGAAILLARHRFPGKRLFSAFIDLPVAVSPIVVGLALLLVYGPNGWFGSPLTSAGITVIIAKPGMVLATVFVSLPLVVRALVPVLEQAGTDQEQAATSLGASAAARFWRITLPTIRVALTYGLVLSAARCLGEYGAVLVVSGNIEGQTETAPLRISNLIENEQNYPAAYAITFVLMVVAFVAILAGAWIRRSRKV